MLHLAEVIKDTDTEKFLLHLLAVEESKLRWIFCNNQYITFENKNNYGEGLLLLVELNNEGQIVDCQLAKDWILSLLKKYLIEGNFHSNINIPEEEARLEKWRQELTSQSQELTRIRLEIETRREELQQLEQNLSSEREKLKSHNY